MSIRNKIVFLDMDGVLVDLERGLLNICGVTFPKEKTPENRIFVENIWHNIAENCPDFWHGLPTMDDYKMLFRYCRNNAKDVFILSATPEVYGHDHRHYECAHYKRMWIQLWLGMDVLPKTIITKSVLKQQVIAEMSLTQPILIDDHSSNIIRWNQAGGIGILYKNARDVIDQLNVL